MPVYTPDCARCGTRFTARRKDARYCGPLCRYAARHDRNREARAEVDSLREALAAALAAH